MSHLHRIELALARELRIDTNVDFFADLTQSVQARLDALDELRAGTKLFDPGLELCRQVVEHRQARLNRVDNLEPGCHFPNRGLGGHSGFSELGHEIARFGDVFVTPLQLLELVAQRGAGLTELGDLVTSLLDHAFAGFDGLRLLRDPVRERFHRIETLIEVFERLHLGFDVFDIFSLGIEACAQLFGLVNGVANRIVLAR